MYLEHTCNCSSLLRLWFVDDSPLLDELQSTVVNTVYHHHAGEYEQKCWTYYYKPVVSGHDVYFMMFSIYCPDSLSAMT